MMKEMVKEHPLRPIVLQFDTKKRQLDFEVVALKAYYRMHDRTWETLQNLRQHKEVVFDLDVRICELEYMLLPIQQQLDFLEAAFQLRENVELPLIEEEFTIDIGEFNRDVFSHNQSLLEINRDVLVEEKWYHEWGDLIYENEDWFDEQDNEGLDLIHEVFRHYEEVSVDIVSLDRDQQEFFGTLADVRKVQDDYFEHASSVLEMYTRVHHLSEDTYRRAERVNEHIEKGLENDDFGME